MLKKLAVIILMLCWGLPSQVQASYIDIPELPDGPATPFVAPLLEVFNSGDRNKVRLFVKQNFTPEFLARFPVEMHVNFMLNTYTRYGRLSYHSNRHYDNPLPENELMTIVKSQNTELWYGVRLSMTSEKPFKIKGLSFSPAKTPSNITKSGTLTIEQAVQELQHYVKRLAKRDVFSGSVLLAKHDKVLYKAAYGMASKRFNVLNNVQTKFNLGSMNKMFTAIAIMQLIEAGKLSLNDKLSEYVDQTWLTKGVSGKIEIRHLLTHSSGLGNYFNQTYGKTSKKSFRALDDYKPLIQGEALQFEPGTNNRYSNTGMFMLGVVIESVSGQDYFSYIREHIYEPAGMKHSDSFEMDQPISNLAIGYTTDSRNQTGWRNNIYTHVLKGGPAGGGFSTVEDLHRFSQALTQFELLGKDFTQAAYTAKPELQSPNYGYGFHVRTTAKDSVIGHGGAFEGISSNLNIHLQQGYVSVVMSNYSGGSRPVERKIQQLLARVE